MGEANVYFGIINNTCDVQSNLSLTLTSMNVAVNVVKSLLNKLINNNFEGMEEAWHLYMTHFQSSLGIPHTVTGCAY